MDTELQLMEHGFEDTKTATEIMDKKIKEARDAHILEERWHHFFGQGRIDVCRKIERILWHDYRIGFIKDNNNSQG